MMLINPSKYFVIQYSRPVFMETKFWIGHNSYEIFTAAEEI